MEGVVSTTAFTAFKNMSYVAVFMTSVEWLGISAESLSVFAALMIIDVITGVIRAASVEGTGSVRSAILKRGVVAKILLLTAIFSVSLAGKGVGFDMAALVQASVTVLILGELYSILGNVYSARTGKPKVEIDAVSFLLDKIKEVLSKFLKT